MEYLQPRFSNRKSFYKKATIITNGDTITLHSYDTDVCSYNLKTHTFKKLWNGYSRTTMEHINEFCNQYDLATFNKKQWDAYPCDNKEKYKVIANHVLGCKYKPTTTFDNYDDAEEYANKLNERSNGLWYYGVEEI